MQRAKKNTFKKPSNNLFPVVGIGASAGGLDAFKRFLKAIPVNSGMAYIIVQHLHPKYDSALPEILQRETRIPVVEIINNVHVEPDFIYVIPSNKLLIATDGILKLKPRPSGNKVNLPIDLFFSSLAEVHRAQSIGVLLSGTGSDGTAGLESINTYGGLTFAQDPITASYAAMPENAIAAGVVNFILSPEKIVEKLVELQSSYEAFSPDKEKVDERSLNGDSFRSILALLKIRKGVDFNSYKQTTIRRRILRRMAILKLETTGEYQHLLKNNKVELDLLFQDLLIQVTSFFRDPESFDTLCDKVLPEILNTRVTDNTIRIWVAGCSSGQEAYSIAICLYEFLNKHNHTVTVKIFATDISEKSIIKARRGIYSKSELGGVSDERRELFFNKKDGHFRVSKAIREMCIFAVHNFLKDPPFAKMHLISCRNVLIYFGTSLQKKALTLFHYASIEKGYLFLGKSETVTNVPELFDAYDKKSKIYIRKFTPERFMNVIYDRRETTVVNNNDALKTKEEKTDNFQKSADEILLAKYTPVGVVVNDQYEIMQFRGATGTYLEPASGKPSMNVLKMAREGLGFEIRNALQKVKNTEEPFVKHGLPIEKGKKFVTIEVIPLLDTIDPHFLILFREESATNNERPEKNELSSGVKKSVKEKNENAKDTRIESLKKELAQARKDMLRIIEDQEATNEELQSSNEELLSGSEELQSLNEELETGKEELQSTNEELISINQELYDRNEELALARRFSDSIISILHEPLLVMDKNYIIKLANNAFYKTFQITEDQTLGKMLFELSDKAWSIPRLQDELHRVQEGQNKSKELEIEHTFPLIGKRDILLNIQLMDKDFSDSLILFALNDITEKKLAEKINIRVQNIERNTEMLNNLYIDSPVFMCTLRGPDYVFDLVNPAYQKLFGNRKLVGKPVLVALPELKDQGFGKILDKIYKNGEIFVANEALVRIATGEGLAPEDHYFNFSYQPIYDVDKVITCILAFGYEVTNDVMTKKKSEKNLRLILDSLPQITFKASAEGKITFLNKYALEFSGLTVDEAGTEKGWKSIIHPEGLANLTTEVRNSLASGEDFYLEIRLKRKRDGEYRWHLMRAIPIKEGTTGPVIMWVGMATDIQQQKLKEQQKDEFLSIASHEVRTPLASIKGYLQLLENTVGRGGKESTVFVNKALNSVNRLNTLVTKLLDVSRIQQGEFDYNMAVVDFNKILIDAIEDEKKATPDSTISKKGKIHSEIWGDRDRLHQVIMNLINNAVKYSPNQKNIRVFAKEVKGEIILSVKDNGIGISKENLERVFKKYYRVENYATRFHGMGIGLYISNEIIKYHGGRMWAESKENEGSTFYFSIPILKPVHHNDNEE